MLQRSRAAMQFYPSSTWWNPLGIFFQRGPEDETPKSGRASTLYSALSALGPTTHYTDDLIPSIYDWYIVALRLTNRHGDSSSGHVTSTVILYPWSTISRSGKVSPVPLVSNCRNLLYPIVSSRIQSSINVLFCLIQTMDVLDLRREHEIMPTVGLWLLVLVLVF